MAPRLVILCSDIESNLTPLMEALEEVFELARVSAPRIVSVLPPPALADAGFRALSFDGERLTPEETARRLSQHLHAVTRTCARLLKEEVLGIYSDVGRLEAQACFHPPGGFPRSGEGDAFQVLRQAAGWLELDANELLRWFGAYDLSVVGSAVPVDATGVPQRLDEPNDEEDAFVEARLQAARELMARYRTAG